MHYLYWSIVCCTLVLTGLAVDSEIPCSSIARLPSLVLSKSTEATDINCVQLSFCTSLGSDTEPYISDTSLAISEYTSNASGAVAVLPSSFSAVLITDDVLGTNSVTIFDFLARPKLLELSTTLANALVGLVKHFNWTRITVIGDATHVFYLHTAELFYMMSSSTSKLDFLQVDDSDYSKDEALRKIKHLNIKIVVLSLRSSMAESILRKRLASKLKWPQYAWIVHSVSKGTSNLATYEGVIELQVKQGDANSIVSSQTENITERETDLRQLCKTLTPSVVTDLVDIYQWVEQKQVFLSNYSTGHGLGPVSHVIQFPSDLPPQYVPTTFITLYYLGIGLCFIVVTLSMILYIYFRNEPAIKATSVPLSILIFIGCYVLIFYLSVLNSTLLPSYHRQSGSFRNFICALRVWLHGLGYPIALITSTLLVKLLRVYRIFHCYGKISVYTSSNTALTVYALLLTSPNALICLVWSSSDYYVSTQRESINDGYLFVTEECQSKYTIQWLLCLLIYYILISIALVITALLTRKVKQKNFKDTKKVSALCFTAIILTITITLSYWYIFRIIQANAILVHAVLQLGHYFLILECQGFLFAPKLYPILKDRLTNKHGVFKHKDTSCTSVKS